MPRHALPSEAAKHSQAAFPGLYSGPPDQHARQRERNQRECADTVDYPSRGAAEQIIVQVHQPGNNLDAHRHGIIEILSCAHIKQSLLQLLALLEPDLRGLVRIRRTLDFRHDVPRVRP
jgi:hypothetical protein